jgi:flagellar basal-body rod protein FlgG
MFRALSTAATGMEAQQTRIDVVANNLANVNTNGFKKSRAEFTDLLYQTQRAAGTSESQGVVSPTGLQVGLGTRAVSTERMHTIGELKQTNNPLDIAVDGDGFIQVQQPNGQAAYTRSGALRLNASGQVVNAEGLQLDPPITVPADATQLTIGSDGTVSAVIAGQQQAVELGQIQLASFTNPAGLMTTGRGLLVPTSASGVAVVGKPGDQGLGRLMQGTLEMSNVKVVEEMIELIAGQRAYDVNSKVIQAADEMLRTTTQLR